VLLISERGLARRQALAATGLLLLGLLLVWVLSAFPSALEAARRFWPEQVIVLGLVGLQALGPTWPAALLLAVGAAARLLLLGAALWRRLPPRPAESASS
jgi:hypothetical protein